MEEPTMEKDNEKKHRGGRLMGKLFKQEKKPTSEVEVDEFLYGPSDKLFMMPTSTESVLPLKRIDTSSARRWPIAVEVNTAERARGRPASSKRSRKGLVVRFYDGQPEVIGEGGEEATLPVSVIGVSRRAQTNLPLQQSQHSSNMHNLILPSTGQDIASQGQSSDSFRPGFIRRTQTGHESVSDRPVGTVGITDFMEVRKEDIPATRPIASTSEIDRRSFVERAKTEMRSEEGLALVRAASRNSISETQISGPDVVGEGLPEVDSELAELHINTLNNAHIPPSPGLSIHSNSGQPETPNRSQVSHQLFESPVSISRTSTLSVPKHAPTEGLQMPCNSERPSNLSRTSTLTLQEAAVAVGDEALEKFSRRTSHMCTLFRLSTEATRPLSRCSLEELVRAGLWWFIKGRMDLEATVRDRPIGHQAQQINFLGRQQAYTDLAKSLWIVDSIASIFPDSQPRSGHMSPDPYRADMLDSRQGIVSGLRKLTMSMERNNFLPHDTDDTLLTQGLDATIWIQDDGDKSLLAGQRLPAVTLLSEALPLGDTTHTFHLGRFFMASVLIVDGAPQKYHCPVLLSIVRNQKAKTFTAVIASQHGFLNLVIQSNANVGPTWEDVRWHGKQNMIEIRLPRGFVLQLTCSEADFRSLWTMHDYENRIHGNMVQRPGERIVFETVVRTLQYFEQTSRPIFTKEPQSHCQLRIFEKILVEKAATGLRTMQRGFRLCLITNTQVKILRGIDQDIPSNLPILFSFLRGDGGLPAFMLKVYGAKSDDTMVFTFNDNNERTRLHMLLTGLSLGESEDVVAEASIVEFSVTAMKDMIPPCFKSLPWQYFKFINDKQGDIQNCKNVLSEQLRVAMDFEFGIITDRINVSPGELRLRLDVSTPHQLKVLRQPQEDLTLSIIESLAPTGLASQMAVFLDVIKASRSTRIYIFPSKAELHLFQSALTGFVVLFDGLATSFSISRRRMVVPIYKKWDAAQTRLQLVQKEKVIQLMAFFEGFSHGDCMNFTLKSTDAFESSTRGGKFSLRIVDAKFAMPKPRMDGENEHEFVCLDMPEYPGEHDDITILFENEASTWQPYP